MSPHNWQYSPKDATSLAAIRWYANMIEAFSIELYASSPETFHQSEHVLKTCLESLALEKQRVRNIEVDDCPDGYDLCQGICKPTCNSEAMS